MSEYIRYTERRALTRPFTPSDEEHRLYEALSSFLQREDTFALPARQWQLTTLILRKLLASSSHAVAGTLETILQRLLALREATLAETATPGVAANSLAEELIAEEELEDDYLDEDETDPAESTPENEVRPELKKLELEIAEVQALFDLGT